MPNGTGNFQISEERITSRTWPNFSNKFKNFLFHLILNWNFWKFWSIGACGLAASVQGVNGGGMVERKNSPLLPWPLSHLVSPVFPSTQLGNTVIATEWLFSSSKLKLPRKNWNFIKVWYFTKCIEGQKYLPWIQKVSFFLLLKWKPCCGSQSHLTSWLTYLVIFVTSQLIWRTKYRRSPLKLAQIG